MSLGPWFVIEVAQAVAAEIGAELVGFRISPAHHPGGDRRRRDGRHVT